MARARVFPFEHGFSPDWRGWPPHLVPAERRLAYWLISTRAIAADEIWYDIRLDGENPAAAKYPAAAEILNPTELRTWYMLNARRADAIVRAGDQYRVIELRDRAGAQTLGEIILYDRLARAEWPELQWLPAVIASRVYDKGIRESARQLGIVTFCAPTTLYDPSKIETRYVPSPPDDLEKKG